MAFRLQEPDYRLGANVAGLFGVVGAVGVLTAPVAGRIADRRGPRGVGRIGVAPTLAAWGVFALWGTITGLVVGVILLEFEVQSALVSNRSVIFALQTAARARLNTLFMGMMFLGQCGRVRRRHLGPAWPWLAGVTMLGTALFVQFARTGRGH